MKIKAPNDHGRSMLDKLNRAFLDKSKPENLFPDENKKKISRDVFEKSPAQKAEKATDSQKPSSDSELNVSFQFDLFYQLSTRVEAKMGQSGATRFAEVSGTVAETFKGSFDLKIDGVGSFFKNTDSALEISPETTNEFFDAVEGLADLSPQALEKFLTETEDFFTELENVYGEADGTFDQIKEQMQQQAKSFFADVGTIREEAVGDTSAAMGEIESAQIPTEALPGGAANNPDVKREAPGQNLIKMLFKPELSVPADKYQDFLEKFIDYTEKFKQQMLENFFNQKPSSPETANLIEVLDSANPTESS